MSGICVNNYEEKKEKSNSLLYLDTNHIIDLSLIGQSSSPQRDLGFNGLNDFVEFLRLKNISVVLSQQNLIELGKHRNKLKREKAFRVLSDFDGIMWLPNFKEARIIETKNAVIDYYGIARDNREDRIRSQITYVYSRSREVTSILNSLLQSISGNRNMFSRAAEDGLGDAMERADQELEQYAQEMESIRLCRKYCNVAEAIRASKLELMKSADVRSAWVEAKDAFGVIVDDGFPDYWSESSLIDLSGQIPSLDVSCCLCAERDFQRFRKIQPNDARDIIALSVAFPNCDYLVVERFFGHIMIQNRYLRDRYNGKVFTSMKEFKDYVNAQSLLKV